MLCLVPVMTCCVCRGRSYPPPPSPAPAFRVPPAELSDGLVLEHPFSTGVIRICQSRRVLSRELLLQRHCPVHCSPFSSSSSGLFPGLAVWTGDPEWRCKLWRESKQSEFHLSPNPVLGSGTAHGVSFGAPSPGWDWYPRSCG